MYAYIFQAALLCEECGAEIRQEIEGEGLPEYVDLNNEYTFDSDEYPKGPYPDGGGEADGPQYCDQCGVFLENPLTEDGYRYLREHFEDALFMVETPARKASLEELREFYPEAW